MPKYNQMPSGMSLTLSLLTSHFSPLKKPQIYKPDSVLHLRKASVIYLVPYKTGSALPTPLAFDPSGDEPKLCEPHINKVYMAFQPARFVPHCSCLQRSCALTTRFHPYLVPENRVKAVIFCDTFYALPFGRTPPVRRCGALCCPDFPPRKATERSAAVFFEVRSER